MKIRLYVVVAVKLCYERKKKLHVGKILVV